MKAYVCHYINNIDRKRELLSDTRFNILQDVKWIDWYNQEDFECYWIKTACMSPLTLGEISCSLKHYEALYDMVKNDIKEALIFEDDVVFIDGWFDKLKECLKPDILFMRLDSMFHLNYTGEILVTTDLWPAEAWYVRKEFAEFILRHSTFSSPIDTFVYLFLQKHNLPVYILPLCSQTSILTKKNQYFRHDDNGKGVHQEWIHYNYFEKKQSLIDASTKKTQLEKKFYDKYGRNIYLRHMPYLIVNDLDIV